MGIINIVEHIKKIHTQDVLLVKIGKFYYVYGKDAFILSYFFNYKLQMVDNKIYSCAFPTSSRPKVIAKLENSKINYIIVNRRENYEVEEKEDYKNLNRYNEYYNKAKKELEIKFRIKRIENYLTKNKDKKFIKSLIFEIEKEIQKSEKNERRKI